MTPASAATLLLEALAGAGQRGLLVADENCDDFPFARLGQTPVLSNRADIAARARAAGASAHFSDFDFSPWQPGELDLIACRVAKEKAVVHHLANRAAALLAPGGRLVLVGAKQEGIKTFAKTLAARLGGESHTEKHGALYRAELTHGSPPGEPLDDRDYDHLRPVFALGGKPVLSKPGLFGWDRIDPGSALLATALDDFLAGFRQPPARILDLGCGYGYLSLVAAAKGDFAITATDNCAAALLACRGNFTALGIAGEVVAADAGDALPGPFDAVLCNPPFHQGFQAERGLTEKFLASTRRLLAPKGRALFVVNGFVPLESLAAGLFGGVRVLDNDGRFKVIELASPRSP
ncbi:MAG: methyltransferase [Porticoccaceae bacterium]|nr:methyltransferase [Porticoccaceae bacterium]MEA3301225.1 methyltransferase [Pseudomonadota bacterium]